MQIPAVFDQLPAFLRRELSPAGDAVGFRRGSTPFLDQARLFLHGRLDTLKDRFKFLIRKDLSLRPFFRLIIG